MAANGANPYPGIPNRSQLSQYVVNREGWEGIRQTVYDSAVYPIAGSSQLTFFAQPVGQGTGFGGGAKTYSDTNMTLAGQFPTNQEFLIQSIELLVETNTPTGAGLAQLPAFFGAQGAPLFINDEWIIRRSGNLQLFIGSKNYLTEAPLTKFPPKAYYGMTGGLGSDGGANAVTNQQLRAATATGLGRPYMLHPASLLLTSNQNFNVTLNWPEGLQPITTAAGGSNFPARIFCYMDGFLYRRSQ